MAAAAAATVLRLTSLRSMESLCHAKNNYNFSLINLPVDELIEI